MVKKLNIGDKARVKKRYYSELAPLEKMDYNGQIGTVIHIYSNFESVQTPLIDLKFDDGQIWCYDYCDLELQSKVRIDSDE